MHSRAHGTAPPDMPGNFWNTKSDVRTLPEGSCFLSEGGKQLPISAPIGREPMAETMGHPSSKEARPVLGVTWGEDRITFFPFNFRGPAKHSHQMSYRVPVLFPHFFSSHAQTSPESRHKEDYLHF